MSIVMRNEGGKINSRINVTPMVDVMLVLLIIFMVVTPLLHPSGPDIQMATTKNPQQMPAAERDDALLVAINRDGQVFLGNEEISPSDLPQKIRDRVVHRTDQRVFVKADARSRYATVVVIVDNIRSAGVSELGLLTEPKRQ